MVLKQSYIKQIVDFVKKEPRTVQDISRLIKKSWLTTDSYVKQIKERTGLIDIKTFRKGTQGALKIVFYNYSDSLVTDDVKESVYNKIRSARRKTDFDFMEVFQFIPEEKKKAFIEKYEDKLEAKKLSLSSLFNQATSNIYCFSGNLSFINTKEKDVKVVSMIEELVKRKIMIKVLCRVDIASTLNINKLQTLMMKYPGFIEIKHCYQPLRGLIIDDKIARFKDEEQIRLYKKEELSENIRIFYEIYDSEWILWLQKVFWNLFRSSIDCNTRLKEIKKIF